MASLNKVMLIGNCTRDPEIRYTPKGTALVELGLAMNRTYTADNGERRDETTFVNVTLWGRTAEIANEYLRKGRPVFIEGRLQLDTWDDKQTGQKRSQLRVVGEGLQLLGSREGGPGGGGGGSYSGPGGEEGDSRPYQRPERSAGGGGGYGGGGQQRPNRPSSPPKAPVDPDLDVEGDDIPF